MLIDIVLVDKRFVGVVGEQALRHLSDEVFRMKTCLQRLERDNALPAPVGKQGIHALDEADEFRVLVDGGLDGKLYDGQIKVADPLPQPLARRRERGE